MSSRLSPQEEQVEALKAECSDTGCKIQSLQAEIESIRALVRPPTSWSRDRPANNILPPVSSMTRPEQRGHLRRFFNMHASKHPDRLTITWLKGQVCHIWWILLHCPSPS